MASLRSLRRAVLRKRYGVKGLRLFYDLARESRGESMHFFVRQAKPEDPAARPVSEPKAVGR